MANVSDYLTPSQNQLMGILRQLIPALGAVAVTLGWVSQEQLGQVTAIILEVAGPIMLIVGWILSLRANTKTSIIKATAGMTETSVTGNIIKIDDPALAQAAREHASATK